MSTEVGSAYISIMPSMRGFGPKLASQSNKAGAAAGKSAGTTFSSGFKSFIGPAALGLAALKGIRVMGGFIDDARESAKVGALTAQVIKSTGGAANISASQVGRLATSISNKTGIDDEAIQSGSNLLLTFTNLRNEAGKGNDIFNRATSIMTDMSTALGTDAKSSAIQLGKALNDPVKGVGALSRVGVSFTAQQKEQIATLVKTGDTLGAQKIILKELSREFGGAAAAASTPFDKLKVTLGNVGENVGAKLIPFIDRAAVVIGGFVTGMQTGSGAGGVFAAKLQQIGGFLQNQVVPGLQEMGRFVMGTVVPGLAQMAAFVKRNADFFIPFAAVLGTLIAGWKVYTAVTKAAAAVQAVFNAVMAANPVGLVVIAIAGLVAGLVVAYKRSETFRNVVNTAFGAVKKAGEAMWNALKAAFGFLTSAFLTVAGVIIHGAAKMFGWVPGVGGKLKSAAAAFDTFRANVEGAMSGLSGKGEALGRDFALGLARGISANGSVPVAAAQGVANRVAAGYAAKQQSSSPSKVAIKLGSYFSEGIAVGIRKGGKFAVDAAQELVDRISSRLSTLRDAAASVRTSVADSVKGIVDVSKIAAPGLDADGNPTAAPSLSDTFAGFAAQAKAFAAALSTMARRKVAPAIIAAIAAAGPASGLTAAQAFANAPDAELSSVNSSMSEIQSAAKAAGNTVLNTTRIPADIKREEKLLAAVERLEAAYKAGNVGETTVKGNDLYVVFKRAEKAASGR